MRVLIAVLAIGATGGLVAVVVFIPAMDAGRKTPERIDACHNKNGEAKLDRGGTYVGCVIPPVRRR
jgi:hypothetical protein